MPEEKEIVCLFKGNMIAAVPMNVKRIITLPEEERLALRSKFQDKYFKSQIYRQRVRSKLNHS